MEDNAVEFNDIVEAFEVFDLLIYFNTPCCNEAKSPLLFRLTW